MAITQEDKELLLKDLCSRLPYGVKFKWCDGYHGDYFTLICINEEQIIGRDVNQDNCLFFWVKDKLKPYLRPMSSMTKEEKEQIRDFWIDANINIHATRLIDFYNKYHFDYRGLIDKGLAIEVTEENNPYKD